MNPFATAYCGTETHVGDQPWHSSMPKVMCHDFEVEINGIRTLGAHLHMPQHEVAADLRQPDASDC